MTGEYFDEELEQKQQNNNSNASSSPSGSMVGDRIQMLGGTKQGFKRPVAPGRRRPATATSSLHSSSSTTSTTNTTSSV